MTDEPFTPRNDLERQLLATQEGATPSDEFMQELLAAQMFMPAQDRDKIQGFQRSTRLAEFTWILEKMGSGYGISINPGWEISLDLPAEVVKQLAASMAATNHNSSNGPQ